MKKVLSIVLLVLIFSCGDSKSSKPNIKENAIKREETKKDYSAISSDVLYKHILAHYDLEEYQLGKEKLTTLIVEHPDLIDSLGLNELKVKFDVKLEELQKIAEEIAAAERRKKLPEEILEKIQEEEDDGLITYKAKSSPKFETNECFYPYYTKDKKGKINLFLKMRYVSATDWLNIKNVIITVDNLDYTITGEFLKIETKGKKKKKTELLIAQINSAEKLKIIQAIANGTDVATLYVSDASYKKRELTTLQKEAFVNVLDAYLYMGGKAYE